LSQLLSKKSYLTVFRSNVCVRLVLDDASKTATPLTNHGAINQTLRQFAPLSDDRLLQLVDCRESSKLISFCWRTSQTA